MSPSTTLTLTLVSDKTFEGEFACDDDGDDDEAKADNGLLGVVIVMIVAITTTRTVIVDHNVGVGGLDVGVLLFMRGFIIPAALNAILE